MRGLIAMAVLLFVFAAAAPAPAMVARGCGPRAARTIESNRLVRVYETRAKHFFACARRGGRKPQEFDFDGRKYLHLRGRYLSYVETGCVSQVGCSFSVTVWDVLADDYPAFIDEVPGHILKTVATSHGEAAALATSQDRSERFVLKLDWMGTSELDRGARVHALTLRDRRLHWLNGDSSRSSPAAHGRRCGPSRGVAPRTLSQRLRVYSVYRAPGEDEFYDYYACLRPAGKPLKLVRVNASPDFRTGTDIGDLALSGEVLAFTEVGCYFGDCNSTFTVTDVRARRRVHSASVPDAVYDVVVSPARVAAGIAFRQSGEYAVIGLDSRGATELDHGSDLHDLTLNGTQLRWFNGTEERTAELR